MPYSHDDLLDKTRYFFKPLDNFLRGKRPHKQQGAENAFQKFVESWNTDFYATKETNLLLIGKTVLIVMVSILINKDVFEPNYNYLKFTVQNYVRLYLHQPNQVLNKHFFFLLVGG